MCLELSEKLCSIVNIFLLAREETETNHPVRPRPGGQINDTFRRLAKPRTTPMTQSVYAGATAHTIPQSRSSHQLRIPTPPVIHPARRVKKFCFEH